MSNPTGSSLNAQADVSRETIGWTPEMAPGSQYLNDSAAKAMKPWFEKNPVPLIDTIAMKEARIKELEAMLTWQPIETAPKDTEVLIYDDINEVVLQAGLRYHSSRGYWAWFTLLGSRNGDYMQDQPSHWMPLPKPPLPTDAK